MIHFPGSNDPFSGKWWSIVPGSNGFIAQMSLTMFPEVVDNSQQVEALHWQCAYSQTGADPNKQMFLGGSERLSLSSQRVCLDPFVLLVSRPQHCFSRFVTCRDCFHWNHCCVPFAFAFYNFPLKLFHWVPFLFQLCYLFWVFASWMSQAIYFDQNLGFTSWHKGDSYSCF